MYLLAFIRMWVIYPDELTEIKTQKKDLIKYLITNLRTQKENLTKRNYSK